MLSRLKISIEAPFSPFFLIFLLLLLPCSVVFRDFLHLREELGALHLVLWRPLLCLLNTALLLILLIFVLLELSSLEVISMHGETLISLLLFLSEFLVLEVRLDLSLAGLSLAVAFLLGQLTLLSQFLGVNGKDLTGWLVLTGWHWYRQGVLYHQRGDIRRLNFGIVNWRSGGEMQVGKLVKLIE